jgi:hypothetical protein
LELNLGAEGKVLRVNNVECRVWGVDLMVFKFRIASKGCSFEVKGSENRV